MAEAETPEERVLRQLLEALLFERLLPCRWAGAGADGWRWLEFRLGDLGCRCLARARGFGRLRIDPASLSHDGTDTGALDWQTLVRRLPAAPGVRDQLHRELAHTLTLCRWNRHHLSPDRDRRALPFEALDSALDEGHPYHPCFKARGGFSLADHRRYGPEAGRPIRLHWLAVARDQMEAALPEDEERFWFGELGIEQAYLLRAGFHRVGANWKDFAAVPVHPWQWQRLRRAELAPALGRGDVRHLGPLGDHYYASQSVRSLFNGAGRGRATVKLPLAMTNTSSLRTLEPHSVTSAPAISRWLLDTLAADPLFRDQYRLEALAEYAALLYRGDPGRAVEQDRLAGQLGCIWRRNLAPCLREGERAVPMNALACMESDGQPFIAPWLRRHGLKAWLQRLLEVVILPVWHLLVAHGIAVEAHAQNSILIHRDGWPVGLALRDFHDSVEYVEDFLPTGARGPDFGPRQALYDQAPADRYYRMAEVEALRALVMDTLFVFNLSELAWLLDQCYQLPETSFWQRTRKVLAGHARRHPQLGQRLARLRAGQARVRTESLLTRKLRGPGAPECLHPVPNTLARPDPALLHGDSSDERARASRFPSTATIQ